MSIMTSREFNQHLNRAQQQALQNPVVITNRGKPTLVLMSYTDYQKKQDQPLQTIAEVLGDDNTASADIDFQLPNRIKVQRREVEL